MRGTCGAAGSVQSVYSRQLGVKRLAIRTMLHLYTFLRPHSFNDLLLLLFLHIIILKCIIIIIIKIIQ